MYKYVRWWHQLSWGQGAAQTKPWIYNLCIIVYGYGIWGCVWSRGAEDTVPVSKAVMRSVESKPVTVVIIFHLSSVLFLYCMSQDIIYGKSKFIIQTVWNMPVPCGGKDLSSSNWHFNHTPKLVSRLASVFRWAFPSISVNMWWMLSACGHKSWQCSQFAAMHSSTPHTLICDHTCTCNILYLSIDCIVHGLCSSLLSTH